MHYLSAEQYTDRQKRNAQRALDTLDRLDERTTAVYQGQRQHERKTFRGWITVCVPDPKESLLSPNEENSFRAWGRSISRSGLSFIHPEQIAQSELLFGITLPNGTVSWISGEIVRRREISTEAFWEYGVCFRARATA